MRILAIDYGTKRLGVALSDIRGRVAFPHAVIPATKHSFDMLSQICGREGVERIVVGLPVSLDGKEHTSARAARKFGERVRCATGIPVEYENEMFTSRMVRGERKPLDDRAAAVFLQSYLDRLRDDARRD